jgi:hypothetical protein
MPESQASIEHLLVGLAFNCLDESEARQAKELAAKDAGFARQLDQLKSALSSFDREPVEPPKNLAQRTLARVAQAREAQSSTIIRMRKAPAPAKPAWNWATWRMADMAVAAGVMVVAGMVAFPSIRQAWVRHREVSCQNNLRDLGVAFNNHADIHNGRYPQISPSGPRSAAGTYLVSLVEKGLLPENHHPVCADPIPLARPTQSELDRLYREDAVRYQRVARAVGGSYAYSLGHINAQGRLEGPRRDQGEDLPLLADRGPRTVGTGAKGNSPNHGGRGQNVLHHGGHVRFHTDRTLPSGDDIYLNANGWPRAGISSSDRVLGSGDDHP